MKKTGRIPFSHLKTCLACLVLVETLTAAAQAQQTITYTDGETNTATIVITANTTDTLSLSSGSATQSGAISETAPSGNIDVNAGTGTIALTGSNTYSGSTRVDFGTLSLEAGSTASGSVSYIGIASGDNAALAVSGASSSGMPTSLSAGSTLLVGVSGGVGFLSLTDGGQISVGTSSAATIEVGQEANSAGTVTVSGVNADGTASTLYSNCFLEIGNGGTGTLNVENGGQVSVGSTPLASDVHIGEASGAATVTVTGVNADGTASTFFSISSIYVGNQGTGVLNVENGGQVLAGNSAWNGQISIGSFGDTGTATVTGMNADGTASTLESNAILQIGIFGASGVLNVEDGGQVLVGGATNGGETFIGDYSGGNGAVTVTGTASSFTSLEYIEIGLNSGSGVLNVDNGGTVASPLIKIAQSGSSSGTINLGSSGVLETGQIINGGATGGTAVNFDGGILKATASSVDFISNFTAGQVTLQGGGGTIDNGGYAITIKAPIGGTGAATFAGSGTTTLLNANNYAGGTVISAGTMALGNGGSLNSAGAVEANGTFDISQAGNQAVGDLGGSGSVTLGGNMLTLGTANTSTFTGTIADGGIGGGTGGSINKAGTGTLALAGANTYSGGTTVSQGALMFQNGAIGSATGTGSLNVAVGAAIGGAGTALTSAFSVKGNIIVGNGTDVTSQTKLTGASASSLTNANLTFNLGTGAQHGESNVLNLGSTPLSITNVTLTLNLVGGAVVSADTVYTLITMDAPINAAALGLTVGANGQVTGGLSIAGNSSFGASSNGYTTGVGGYTGSYLYINGNSIDLMIAPEPSTWTLLGGGVVLLLLTRQTLKAKKTQILGKPTPETSKVWPPSLN